MVPAPLEVVLRIGTHYPGQGHYHHCGSNLDQKEVGAGGMGREVFGLIGGPKEKGK